MAERMWDYYENNNVSVSQEAKNWTERSKESKLNEILHKLNDEEKKKPNNDKLKKIQKLQNILIKWEYSQFQKEIWMTNCNWKLWGKTLEMFENFLKKLDQVETSQQDTQQQLSNLLFSIKKPEQTTYNSKTIASPETTDNHVDNLKISRATKKFLSKHEKLSEGEYNRIFAWKEIIQQWQLWDCYLVSWIIELSNTQYFDTLMRTSITRVRFRDDNSLWYTIKIPLWEPNGRDILIKDSELDTAKIKWNIGYKLLEIAYVKNKRPNDINWNRYSPVTESEFAEIWKWWSSTIVLRTFLGKHNIWFNDFWTANTRRSNQTLSALSRERKVEITNFLKHYNWNIWNRFVFLWTADFGTDSFYVWNNLFYTKHSYAISSVKLDWNWRIEEINLKNPGNDPSIEWWSDAKINLNDFFNAFSYIEACKVNTDTFLRS